MKNYKVPTLSSKTSDADQSKLMSALKGVPGVENATLDVKEHSFSIKPLAGKAPLGKDIAAASKKAGFNIQT